VVRNTISDGLENIRFGVESRVRGVGGMDERGRDVRGESEGGGMRGGDGEIGVDGGKRVVRKG
jgi:hypothetical protein